MNCEPEADTAASTMAEGHRCHPCATSAGKRIELEKLQPGRYRMVFLTLFPPDRTSRQADIVLCPDCGLPLRNSESAMINHRNHWKGQCVFVRERRRQIFGTPDPFPLTTKNAWRWLEWHSRYNRCNVGRESVTKGYHKRQCCTGVGACPQPPARQLLHIGEIADFYKQLKAHVTLQHLEAAKSIPAKPPTPQAAGSAFTKSVALQQATVTETATTKWSALQQVAETAWAKRSALQQVSESSPAKWPTLAGRAVPQLSPRKCILTTVYPGSTSPENVPLQLSPADRYHDLRFNCSDSRLDAAPDTELS